MEKLNKMKFRHIVDAFDHFSCGILCFNDSKECYRHI